MRCAKSPKYHILTLCYVITQYSGLFNIPETLHSLAAQARPGVPERETGLAEFFLSTKILGFRH